MKNLLNNIINNDENLEKINSYKLIAKEKNVPFAVIGKTGGKQISIQVNDESIIDMPVAEAQDSWEHSIERNLES